MASFNGSGSAFRIVATPNVVALDATASLADAAQIMFERGIGSVGVCDRGELVGLVSERDLVMAMLLHRGKASQPIRDAMRPGLPHVDVGATENACASLMRRHCARHLLVEDHDCVVGLVSMTDLVHSMLHEREFLIEQLNTYISGTDRPADMGVAPLC